MTVELRTSRLILRPWRSTDRAPFAAMNADPEVMHNLPQLLTSAQSDELIDRIEAHFDEWGYGLWAVEIPGVADLAGFIGLTRPTFDAPFMPAVEVGWRLARAHWGSGYATEGARAAALAGFETFGLDEIVSFTIPEHRASRAVMERLGMSHDAAGDFDHPRFPPSSRFCRHVLYRLAPADLATAAGPTGPGADQGTPH